MMAVAAFSMSTQDGKERLDALQHYQKALPLLQNTLKSTDDLSSDGAFLTHFLLLIYEVRTQISGDDLADKTDIRGRSYVVSTSLHATADKSTAT
jgi:hypothetical protein